MLFLVASWRPSQAAACRGCRHFAAATAASGRRRAAAMTAAVAAAADVCRQGGSL